MTDQMLCSSWGRDGEGRRAYPALLYLKVVLEEELDISQYSNKNCSDILEV